MPVLPFVPLHWSIMLETFCRNTCRPALPGTLNATNYLQIPCLGFRRGIWKIDSFPDVATSVPQRNSSREVTVAFFLDSCADYDQLGAVLAWIVDYLKCRFIFVTAHDGWPSTVFLSYTGQAFFPNRNSEHYKLWRLYLRLPKNAPVAVKLHCQDQEPPVPW